MVVSTTFTANFPVGPSERSAGIILGLYSDKAVFLIWYCISLSPNEIYLCLHSLTEICGLVQYYVHQILYNLWPMYELIGDFPLL